MQSKTKSEVVGWKSWLVYYQYFHESVMNIHVLQALKAAENVTPWYQLNLQL